MTRPLYRVTCEPWERGLVLHIDGVGVTQTHQDYPDTVEDMARSYIALMCDVPEDSFDLEITGPAATEAIQASPDEDDHRRRVREAAERAMRVSRGLCERLAPFD